MTMVVVTTSERGLLELVLRFTWTRKRSRREVEGG